MRDIDIAFRDLPDGSMDDAERKHAGPAMLSSRVLGVIYARPDGAQRASCAIDVITDAKVRNPDTGAWESTGQRYDEVLAFGQLAEQANVWLHEGMRVVVRGQFWRQSWTGPDGTRHTRTKVLASDIGISIRGSSTDELTTLAGDEQE